MQSLQPSAFSAEAESLSAALVFPLEIRVHGRGGQGGVTCAKLIASLFTYFGLHVQTFGDYGSERTGAPVQAYTRVDRDAIVNRNKVYRPDHLLVLDEGLLGPTILAGTSTGAVLLLNSHQPLQAFDGLYDNYRLGVVDATAIAREHGIGSSSVVIINTTILGAYARLLDIPLKALEHAYASLGLEKDIAAAEHAYAAVQIREPAPDAAKVTMPAATAAPTVKPVNEHSADIPATLRTGAWSNQIPRYREHTAPCNLACPAGNDVVGFIQALKKQGLAEAAAVLLRTQPLPSVCGRVCPAPCMAGCNRTAFDGAVNIRGLERWIGDHAKVMPVKHEASRAFRFAVVGGGPAGLSAAYQLALRGHAVTIYEAAPALGGVLRNGIPAFRLTPEDLQRDLDRILALGVDVQCGHPVDAEGMARLRADHDAVIVCSGFGAPVGLSAPGDDLSGIEQGLPFLDRVKAHSEAVHGHVVVIGGGNSAIDCVRSALRCGAASVKLVYRRSREDMPAILEEIDAAEHEGVRIVPHRQPVAFIGEAGKLTGIVVAEVEAGPPDASGRRRPVVSERTSTIVCDKVLLALGQDRGLDTLPAVWRVDQGRAWHGEQALPVWFAGDCATADGTVTHAIGNGRRVALAALAELIGEAAPPSLWNGEHAVTPGEIIFSHFGVAPMHKDREISLSARLGNFNEVNLGLAGPEEADRCFSCGHCTHCDTCLVYCPEGIIGRDGDGYIVDADYCKGCGMCVAECPRDAMEMHEKMIVVQEKKRPGAAA